MTAATPARRMIALSGVGTRDFLNDLLTQTIPSGADHALTYAGLLSPQGKVITDMFVLGLETDRYLIDAPGSRADDLLNRLQLYRLRKPLTIAFADDWRVWRTRESVAGAHADPRLPALGARVYGQDQAGEDDPTLGRARIEAGVPYLPADAAPDEVFALEALFEELNGVDFQKGCFVGQENVSRMKRRATVRRKFCRVRFDGPLPSPGTAVTADGAAIGDVRSGVEGCALALIRLDRAREATDKGVTLEAGATPIRLDPPDWLILPAAGDD